MPFCKNCGRLNDVNAKFCGVCGASLGSFEQPPAVPAVAPVYAAPPPPPPPPSDPQQTYYRPPQNYQQQPTYQTPPVNPQPTMPQSPVPAQNGPEKVLGVIMLRKPKSLGRYDSWTAVITNNRLIFAQMTSQMITDATTQARAQAKADGKGFLGQWGEQLRSSFGYSRRYFDMDPSAALAETPGNFAVDNYGISEVKLKLKNISRGQDVDLQEFEIEIASAQGKYEFRMDENDACVNLLKQIYGQKVKMPFGYLSSGGVKMKLF